jgi:hypothetical protein
MVLLDESLVIEDQEIDGREDEKIEMSLESSGNNSDNNNDIINLLNSGP